MSTELYQAGYRAVSVENNVMCEGCVEFTFVRLKCPELALARSASGGNDSRASSSKSTA
jgi:hypothetical protein